MADTSTTDLSALALVCTLTPSPGESSSELMARQVLASLAEHGVSGDVVRMVDHDVKPGVQIDMGNSDAWPAIRERMMAADILLVATPIWLGHTSSVAQRVLERLDAELAETDDEGRLRTFGKVGVVAVVGNEDGAHHVSAELMQGLDDVGFSLPAGGAVYWVGRAMEAVDYKDLDAPPEKVASTMKTLAANAAHLARLLRRHPYPPV
ncbi:MAG TPA: NAD(P)H-dependent oxidoreductase [Actinomycetales bacterium]|nr:NAD(P)H-dependent oxidoreductase [Actinomycetales bacterium]